MDPLFLFFFTVIASTEGFLVGVSFLILLLVARHRAQAAVWLALSAAGLIVAVNVLKETFQIPRPVEALIETTGYAFPSGHAAGAFFLAAVVVYLVRKHSKIVRTSVTALVVTLAIAIAWSRLALQVHTLEQVSVGALIGITFAVAFAFLSRATFK